MSADDRVASTLAEEPPTGSVVAIGWGEDLTATRINDTSIPKPILVPDGERAKTWPVLGHVLEGLIDRGLRRT